MKEIQNITTTCYYEDFLFPSCFSFLQIVCILKSTKNPLCPEGELAASEQLQEHF